MQQEWDKLWTKVWLLACREEDLPEPGDHYVTEIGVESIFAGSSERYVYKGLL